MNEGWSGEQLLAAFKAAAHWLEQHAPAVNALNVFPVPDGDTGTNMSLTLSGAVKDVAPDRSCAVVADRVKYWAIMRGRGNSGIILSQVLRGAAQGLAGHERMGAAELVAALTQASATAYKAVIKPIEGTMLTVIRETSQAAATALDSGDVTLLAVLEAAARGARASVDRTPTLLKTLRDAGVVDSGGEGLFLILEGMLRYARGESIEFEGALEQAPARMAFEDIHGPEDFGYCTNFILQGVGMPYDEIRAMLASMGQSVVVVGDDELIKVHLHLLRPGDALNYAIGFGTLEQIEITNMDLQRERLHQQQRTENREPRTENREPQNTEHRTTDNRQRTTDHGQRTTDDGQLATQIGIVAVAPGPGFAAIFRSLQAGAVVGGGQTMNPSAEDLLAAIEELPQRDVIVLPNNSNIIMAARQAAQLSDKRIEVLSTKTAPQGIAALLGFNYQAGVEENVRAMMAAISQIDTAEVTSAVRDAVVGGVAVRGGQTIGLLNGDLVTAADEREPVIDELLQRMQLDDCEIVTIYYGQAVDRSDAEGLSERIQERFPAVEVEIQDGGQPLYDYIISAE